MLREFARKGTMFCLLSALLASAAAYSQQTAPAPYTEPNRPAFHFTMKKGWSNDVNGPIFWNGQYHLFFQSIPYRLQMDGALMEWGHAVSKDLVHWRQLPSALAPDKLGAAWSGTSILDRDNAAGFGKNAFVVFYTAFNPATGRQVQCIAFSTDNGATFTRYSGNPVLDTGAEVGSNDTRDPKVFWYAPARHWVLVLFEKDGMSIFNSADLKHWTRKSHIAGLFECPDLFELPVDGNAKNTRWVLHGGSSSYFIGSFNGETFTPETPLLRYAEGKNRNGDDVLYASQSFENMPDHRRVQMAWGRIEDKGMPFNQMLLFPTEFRIISTPNGLRLASAPISEIHLLQGQRHAWQQLASDAANQNFRALADTPLHVTFDATLKDGRLEIVYGSKSLAVLDAKDAHDGQVKVDLLIDKTVAEIFVNGGEGYILADLTGATETRAIQLKPDHGPVTLTNVQMYEMKSMWQ